MTADVWTIAEAKAKFSEVIDLAVTSGPQTITRNGHTTAVNRLGGGMVAPAQAHRHTR